MRLSRLGNSHIWVELLKFTNIILFGYGYIHFHIHICIKIQNHICICFCKMDPDIYHIHFHGRPDSDIFTSISNFSNTDVE